MPPERQPFRPALTRLEQYDRDREAIIERGYKFMRLDLSVARSFEFPFVGNVISIWRLVGATPELRVRRNSTQEDWERITSEGELRGPFNVVWFAWDAIVGGFVDIHLATELY